MDVEESKDDIKSSNDVSMDKDNSPKKGTDHKDGGKEIKDK